MNRYTIFRISGNIPIECIEADDFENKEGVLSFYKVTPLTEEDKEKNKAYFKWEEERNHTPIRFVYRPPEAYLRIPKREIVAIVKNWDSLRINESENI